MNFRFSIFDFGLAQFVIRYSSFVIFFLGVGKPAAVLGGTPPAIPMLAVSGGEWSSIMEAVNVALVLGGFWILMRKISGVKEERMIGPQPLVVKEQEKFMTQAQCRTAHGEFERRVSFLERHIMDMDSKMDAHILRLEQKGEERAVKIHARIDGLSERVVNALGELKGEIKRIK